MMDNRYEEALEKAKELYLKSKDTTARNVLEEIFPQLKESSDEKIRKELIDFFKKGAENGEQTNGIYDKDILAWLEKQGKQQKPVPKFKVGDTMRTLQEAADNIISGLPVVISIDKEYYHCTNELIAIKDQDDYEFPPMNKIQTHTDKVEPEFKAGDWIVNNVSKDIFLIKSINNRYCTLEDINGIIISPCLPPCESESHLWTISDAKKGDVLVDKYGNIGIYQGDKNAVTWNSYCYCGVNKVFYNKGSHEFPCYPATKEQRDQLEKAMDDAGYTFDFEKKKLKKLKFKVGDEVISENERSLTITKIDEEGYWSDDLFICDFDSECNWNLVEQKPDDNVEPKFKIGDYVVDNCGYIWRIEEIINQFYILEGIDGGESRPTIEWVNKTLHLWDIIKDAKDSDILAFKNNVGGIIICKSPTYYDTRSYCRLLIDGNFINEEESGWDSTLLIPASKEQRDKLEKAMAKSGYEFDFRKKELKEIEQNPEYAQLTEFEGAVKDMINVYRDAIGDSDATTEEVKEHSAYLQSLIPQTPAWSEEDEMRTERLLYLLDNGQDNYPQLSCDFQEIQEIKDWLKSLRPKRQ